MSAMTDTIMQQVTEQVKKAMEAASSPRPLPHFDYMPNTGCQPSHRHTLELSHHHSDGLRETTYPDRTADHREKTATAVARARDGQPSQPQPQRCTQRTPDEPPGSRSKSKPRDLEGKRPDDNALLSIARAVNVLAAPHLERGVFLRKEREPIRPEPLDVECCTEIVATIAGGYVEGITRFAWKAQLRGAL
ncbi:hypothetical protein Cgig2_033849 [Carnegiea gigantea]|uniref:Uncharacterized protein n=1 Tax=Carnegiea gigantea TaxID=171969 RepID=A0A9Q1GX29_9CARY|nr:hypothetical protein Cgig2_033849 [Carnegiea gigantea]